MDKSINDLYNLFTNEINSVKIDLNYTEFDFKFEREIGFDNALKIRKTIFNEFRKRYCDFSLCNINDTFEIIFNDIFFNKIIINIFYNNNEKIKFDFDNININLYIYCKHPIMFNFKLIRYVLLVVYYKYLKKNKIENNFIGFMENLGYSENNLSINILLNFINNIVLEKNIDFKTTQENFI